MWPVNWWGSVRARAFQKDWEPASMLKKVVNSMEWKNWSYDMVQDRALEQSFEMMVCC